MNNTRYQGSFLKYLPYKNDPARFIETVLKIKLFDWQKEVCEYVKNCFDNDKKNVTCLLAIAGGNNTGKTLLGKALSLWHFATQFESKNMLLTNSETQTRNTCYQDLKSMAEKLWGPTELFSGDKKICPKNQGDSWYFTFFLRSGFESAITGRHYPSMFFFLDECLMFDEYIWKGLETMCLSGRVLVYASANPLPEGIGEGFHRIFTDEVNLFNWYRKSVSLYEIPEESYDHKFIEHRKKKYGEDSAIYRASVLGVFSDECEGARLFTDKQIHEAFNSEATDDKESIVLSIDVSETHVSGSASALCVRQGKEFLYYDIDFGYYEDFVRKVFEVIRRYYPIRIIIDVNGHGTDLYSKVFNFVQDELYFYACEVVGIKGSYKSSDPRFCGIRSQLAYKWACEIRYANASLPKEEALLPVLKALTFSSTSQGKIQLVPKAHLKKQIGSTRDGSVDLFDAVLYSYY